MTQSLADKFASEFGIGKQPTVPSQSGALDEIFSERPPTLHEFLSDPQYLGTPFNLSAIQFDAVRHFEQIYYPETYDLMVAEWGDDWQPVRYVNELVLEWGKGSGKDLICQIALARVANLVICLKNPQQYYGLAENSYIHTLNVASSAPQAHRAFFKPLRALLARSKWFSDKWESGEPPGPMAQTMRLVKQVELISGHSDAETLEGNNLLAGIADEISAFTSESEASRTGKALARTSDGLLDMLRSSATTRFPTTFKVAAISYPRRKGDAIQQLRSKFDDRVLANPEKSTAYSSGPHASWAVNPNYDKYERVHHPGSRFGEIPNIPSLVEQYDADPVPCRAKYECAPEFSVNPRYPDKSVIYSSFARKLDQQPLTIHYRFGVDHRAGEVVPAWQAEYEFSDALVPLPGAIYALHADMAVKGDRAGVTMSHVASWRDVVVSDDLTGAEESTERRPVVTVDFSTAWEANKSAVTEDGALVPREIQIRWFRKLAVVLQNRGFYIGHISMDGFQSTDSIQILKSQGFDAKRVSIDRDDTAWKTLADLMYESRLTGYSHPLLIRELEQLTKLSNGKVDHPVDGSKDVADSLAGSVMGAIVCGGQEEEDDVRGMDSGALFGVGAGAVPEGSMFGGMAGNPYASPFGSMATPMIQQENFFGSDGGQQW